MKLDRTLIDKDGAPGEEKAREFFLKHDYTTHRGSCGCRRILQG